jgi:hypothetical protein
MRVQGSDRNPNIGVRLRILAFCPSDVRASGDNIQRKRWR